jgi:uncharacterized protein
MPGLVPGIHVFFCGKTWMAGHRRAEATPFFERLCPAMTNFLRGVLTSARSIAISTGPGTSGLLALDWIS